MNIALTGMPGSGKTSVGTELKNLLSDFDFIDTDELIVKSENRTINDIFAQDGEEYFRKIETEILKNVLTSDNHIISTGGGIILKEENRSILKAESTVIYLKTSPETLYERVKNNNDRPLLNTSEIFKKINDLYEKRAKLYEETAKYTVNTDNLTPDKIAKEIYNIWKR